MARMVGADWQGEHGELQMARYDIVCIHTIVGNAPAHAAHFSVRGDGYVYQSRDTAYRSAANLEGNHRIIAIENDDHGPEFGTWNVNDGHAVPAFSNTQIEAIAKVLVFAYQTHGIPLVSCPDSRPTSRGIAYHRQGVDGNFAGENYAYGGRVSGGEHWSTFNGKVCPGDRRIAQIPQIIARARQLAGLDPLEDDVALTDSDINRIWMFPCTGTGPDGASQTFPAFVWFSTMAFRTAAINAGVAELLGRDPVDIDEASVAANLAPVLIVALEGQITEIGNEDLDRIATAVADENARRQQE